MRPSRRSLWPFALLLAAVVSSCTDTTTNPGVGSGTSMAATVNGTRLTFDLVDVAGFNTYTVATHEGRFGSTLVGSPSKTITVRFTSDIDGGSFPRTLTGDDVSVNYAEVTGTTTKTYDCPISGNSCSVTLTATNGTIVDGTFTATLMDQSNPPQTVTITGGTFSAKLVRQ